MASEKKRGCGYRKVGGSYLMGEGFTVPCDALPLPLDPCECCGFTMKFYRGFTWVQKQYIVQRSTKKHKKFCGEGSKMICRCFETCPICHPETNDWEKYGFMWVGERYYTPESFVREARKVGVCKRISQLPKDLVFGETWILLAHKKVPIAPLLNEDKPNGLLTHEPEFKEAIFYAFRPTRVEKLVWQSQLETEQKKLEHQGLTLIPIPDGDVDHA